MYLDINPQSISHVSMFPKLMYNINFCINLIMFKSFQTKLIQLTVYVIYIYILSYGEVMLRTQSLNLRLAEM
jgi:hypothetical protein